MCNSIEKKTYMNNSNHICYPKNNNSCKKINFLDSLFCVENFLCCSQEAYKISKFINFFN